jgi:hypothetical protein
MRPLRCARGATPDLRGVSLSVTMPGGGTRPGEEVRDGPHDNNRGGGTRCGVAPTAASLRPRAGLSGSGLYTAPGRGSCARKRRGVPADVAGAPCIRTQGLQPLYCPWPRLSTCRARPSLCALASLALRGTPGGATMYPPVGRAHSREHCNSLRARRTGFSHRVGVFSLLFSGPSLCPAPMP